jgi:hypothetical protein
MEEAKRLKADFVDDATAQVAHDAIRLIPLEGWR